LPSDLSNAELESREEGELPAEEVERDDNGASSSKKLKTSVLLPKGKSINPQKKHPVMVLQELVPGLAYDSLTFGSRRLYFVTEVVVKGIKYTGEAYNRKTSKLRCALKALKEGFGIEYPEHEFEEDSAL
jgi:hypothetical protein